MTAATGIRRAKLFSCGLKPNQRLKTHQMMVIVADPRISGSTVMLCCPKGPGRNVPRIYGGGRSISCTSALKVPREEGPLPERLRRSPTCSSRRRAAPSRTPNMS
jgi:hypothetical protein